MIDMEKIRSVIGSACRFLFLFQMNFQLIAQPKTQYTDTNIYTNILPLQACLFIRSMINLQIMVFTRQNEDHYSEMVSTVETIFL